MRVGPARFRFLRESLEALAASRRGDSAGGCVLRRGPAAEALPRLLEETGASRRLRERRDRSVSRERGTRRREALAAAGARLRLFPDSLLVEPDAHATDAGDPYTVYTPFARRWALGEKALSRCRRPRRLAGPLAASVPIERVRALARPRPGSERSEGRRARGAARSSSDSGAGRSRAMPEDRNRPDLPATSRLSPHLHFGTISPRTIRAAADDVSGTRRERALGAPVDSCRARLARVLPPRSSSTSRAWPRESFRPRARRPARGATTPRAWRRGRPARRAFRSSTPRMRELSTTHWMHNRARMVAASFLTKDLHVHWREGERWFEHELADADLPTTTAAGSGRPARDRRRAVLPDLQSRPAVEEASTPTGAYIRRFVPELARVPARQHPRALDHDGRRAARLRLPDRAGTTIRPRSSITPGARGRAGRFARLRQCREGR